MQPLMIFFLHFNNFIERCIQNIMVISSLLSTQNQYCFQIEAEQPLGKTEMFTIKHGLQRIAAATKTASGLSATLTWVSMVQSLLWEASAPYHRSIGRMASQLGKLPILGLGEPRILNYEVYVKPHLTEICLEISRC